MWLKDQEVWATFNNFPAPVLLSDRAWVEEWQEMRLVEVGEATVVALSL